MSERNQQNNQERNATSDNLTGKEKGMQGIDKAPGEEPAQDTEKVTWETQKGRNKNDGNPSEEGDKPMDQ